ncbi:peptidoglycan-recognition protein LC isoform X1 [Bactrocera dorsalis]|uniref:Peptidoglycan-recognition protein LC isoform X1 n=1 Tax=Bactrocera dorsalis TaxID=27457 RepID=A0A6J0RP06_BACDO|nr:peptidoglycan-recognition protein LC isoform X1 [Bactrocera dorsalis]XP_019847712.2 peptidoglycan-recognition protein LC isoform X1 [Bactrocera dorsalis]XP_049317727.1 peptidoglycan-recognition protein LC isoform X1 [Bactrocera dorsalis]
MHLKNDNEMNSNPKISAHLNIETVAVKPSAFSATSAGDEAPITPSTSSAGSCASSTDSGVIISDYKSLQVNNVDINRDNFNCNGTSGNNAKDNSKSNSNSNIANSYDDKRRRSVESLKTNKNITINTQIDNNSINIENVINVRRQRNSSGSRVSSKNGSPAVSIRSNTISIISIDENAIDSSVVDSDSDYEGQYSGCVVKKLGQQTTYEPNHPNLPNINKGMQVLSQTISPGAIPPTAGPLSETILNGGALAPPVLGPPTSPNSAQIGSIALSNSTDVTFGDKHFYEGPVTIQQFLIDSRDKWKNGEDGNDNPAFTGNPENGEKPNSSTTPPETSYIFNFHRRAVIITGAVILLTILTGIAIVTVNALTKQTIRKSKLLGDGDDSRKHIPINSTIADDNVGGGKILRIVPRDAWLAQPPSSDPLPLATPVKKVIVLPTRTDDCETQAMCVYRVRMTQTLNIESQNHDDIIYNFLIGGDGNVYEGRGWDAIGAHLRGFNSDSISFAYIGTFKKQKPSEKQMDVTKLLLAEGVRLGKLSQDYKIYGAYMLDPTSTDVQSDELYNSFKGWPHWSEYVTQ